MLSTTFQHLIEAQYRIKKDMSPEYKALDRASIGRYLQSVATQLAIAYDASIIDAKVYSDEEIISSIGEVLAMVSSLCSYHGIELSDLMHRQLHKNGPNAWRAGVLVPFRLETSRGNKLGFQDGNTSELGEPKE